MVQVRMEEEMAACASNLLDVAMDTIKVEKDLAAEIKVYECTTIFHWYRFTSQHTFKIKIIIIIINRRNLIKNTAAHGTVSWVETSRAQCHMKQNI
jgi:hypothetical protein